jgi:hypothetical protein
MIAGRKRKHSNKMQRSPSKPKNEAPFCVGRIVGWTEQPLVNRNRRTRNSLFQHFPWLETCIDDLSTAEDGGLAELRIASPGCPTNSHAHDSPRAFSECTNIED